MQHQLPQDLIKAKDELSERLSLKIEIVRGRKSSLEWILSTLPEEQVLRKNRYVLPRGGKKFIDALDFKIGQGAYYVLLYQDENLPNLNYVKIEDKSVVFIQYRTIVKWVDQVYQNPHLPYVETDIKEIFPEKIIPIELEKLKGIGRRREESIFSKFVRKISRVKRLWSKKEETVFEEIAEKLSKEPLKTREDVLNLLKDKTLLRNLDIYNLLLSRLSEGITAEEEINEIKRNVTVHPFGKVDRKIFGKFFQLTRGGWTKEK